MNRLRPHRLLRTLRLHLLRWVGRPVLCTHHGHRIEIDPRDEFIAAELLVDGTWEESLIREVTRIPLRGRIAIDVGAHVGIHSLVLSDLVGDTGSVIALEPEPVNFERLGRNLTRNRATNVTAIQAAAGRSAGTAGLRTVSPNLGAHRIVRDDGDLPVRLVALDTLADPAEVAFVKIDAEGYEHEVLAGMKTIIDSSFDLTFYVEVEATETDQLVRAGCLIEALHDSGFRTRVLDRGQETPTRAMLAEVSERLGVIHLFASRLSPALH